MLQLTADEKAILNSKIGSAGDNMALNIVVKAAEMLGASRLVDITSSHIDGCLYHGDSGVLFCETLAKNGAKTKVPTTTNVGALNLIKTNQARLSSEKLHMAQRLMDVDLNRQQFHWADLSISESFEELLVLDVASSEVKCPTNYSVVELFSLMRFVFAFHNQIDQNCTN